ncbi:MAG: hypothetical protein ACKVE3_08375 [Dissulfuribacterales bacterium]
MNEYYYRLRKEDIIMDDEVNKRIADDLKEMKEYEKLHHHHKQYKRSFKKCPVCGSKDIVFVDMRSLGRRKTSVCKQCGYTS